jgi:hypothetical protein
MTTLLKFSLTCLSILAVLGSGGCVMKRTVTEGGAVVSEKYIVKRPLRDAPSEPNDEN